jgi:hypothetical protein
MCVLLPTNTIIISQPGHERCAMRVSSSMHMRMMK